MSEHTHLAGGGDTAADLLVGGLGFVTSLVTAVLLWGIEQRFGVALYSWMFWLVVPVGAGLAGLAAASGYYAGARLFNRRPTRRLLANVILASVATFFLIHYLSYVTLEVDGVRVSEFFPFSQYLDIAIRSTSMSLGVRAAPVAETGALGTFGYAVALLQVVGFALGGFLVYVFLSDLPYCAKCSRYLRHRGSRERYSSDAETVAKTASTILGHIQTGSLTAAIEVHRGFGGPICRPGDHLRATIDVHRCTRCGQHWLKFSVDKGSDDSWREIPELTVSTFTQEVIGV